MKKTVVLISIIALLIIVFIGEKQRTTLVYETTEIKIGTTTIMAEIADTKEKRELGLADRKNLPSGQGMFFVFDQPAKHGFWMKEMNFPIDIIWFDQNKKIIGVTKNLLPNSYPQIFYPPSEILYALEVGNELFP